MESTLSYPLILLALGIGVGLFFYGCTLWYHWRHYALNKTATFMTLSLFTLSSLVLVFLLISAAGSL
jgi:hypothetical protein